MNRTQLWISLVLLAGPSATVAQEAEIPDSTVVRLRAALVDREQARAWTQWGPFVLEGPTISSTGLGYARVVTDTAFLAGTAVFPHPIPLGMVSAIAVERRRPVVTAVRVGAAFALVGALLGALDSSQDISCAVGCRDIGMSPGRGALTFGAIGVVIGLVTGSVVPSWQMIYRSPD